MHKSTFCPIIVILLFVALPGKSYGRGAGAASNMGLKLTEAASARAGGMGQAAGAIEGDLSLVHYNPAGLARMQRPAVSFSYALILADMNFGNIIYAHPFLGGVMGGGLSCFSAGELVLDYADGTEQTLNAQTDIMLTISYAKEIFTPLAMGVNVKLLHSTLLEKYSGSAYMLDLGAVYQTPLENFTVAGVVQDMGTKLKYYQAKEPLSTNLKLGTAYTFEPFSRWSLLTHLELDYLVNEDMLIPRLGFELTFNNMFAIRAGYMAGTISGLTLGTGIKLNAYVLDYSLELIPEEDMVANHRISLRIDL
jgi:hypothetical protein